MDNLAAYIAGLLFGLATIFVYWWSIGNDNAPRNQGKKKSVRELSEQETEEWLAADLEKEFEADPLTAPGGRITINLDGKEIRLKILYYLDQDQILTLNPNLGVFAIGYHPKHGKFWMDFHHMGAWQITIH